MKNIQLAAALSVGLAALLLSPIVGAQSGNEPATAIADDAKDSNGTVGDQFKFMGGEKALGDTALHKEWKLAWEDDFSKDRDIDKTKWNFEINGNGGGNGELEYYTDSPKNAHIDNGELVITALKNDDGHKFTSARMTTSGKFSCLYGRIEACIKAPNAQQGNWPAFWMMPQDSKYGSWPRSGEIDIMELINGSDKLYGTAHYGGEHGDIHTGAQAVLPGTDFTKNYHVYAIEWDSKEIRWYVDGNYYGSIHTWHSAGAAYPAPFDQKFYIILNYAIGGVWPHSPNQSSRFPQSMHVKYVRVYQP